MVPPLGVQIFWMIALGSTLGFAAYYAFFKHGVGLLGSVLTGTLGAVIVGVITYVASFDLPMMYAVLGSITFLFVTNVFLQKDLFG